MSTVRFGQKLFNILRKYRRFTKTEFGTIGEKFLFISMLVSVFFTATLVIMALGAIAFNK
jgi:hypothetical protein